MKLLAPSVKSNEFGFSQDVTFDDFEEILFLGAFGESEQSVEGVEFEKVAMGAARGTRAAVAQFWPRIYAGNAHRAAFGNFASVEGDIVQKPVYPVANRCIGVIDEERKTCRAFGRVGPGEWRGDIVAVTGVFGGNGFALLECGADESEAGRHKGGS